MKWRPALTWRNRFIKESTSRASPLRRILQKPFAKRRIESLALRAGNEPRLLDQVFIRT